jgi:hypothetical protein
LDLGNNPFGGLKGQNLIRVKFIERLGKGIDEVR